MKELIFISEIVKRKTLNKDDIDLLVKKIKVKKISFEFLVMFNILCK